MTDGIKPVAELAFGIIEQSRELRPDKGVLLTFQSPPPNYFIKKKGGSWKVNRHFKKIKRMIFRITGLKERKCRYRKGRHGANDKREGERQEHRHGIVWREQRGKKVHNGFYEVEIHNSVLTGAFKVFSSVVQWDVYFTFFFSKYASPLQTWKLFLLSFYL